mgnify:CR=1 FL=1
MLKLLTYLALISTSFVQGQPGEKPPPACPDTIVLEPFTPTEEVCSRTIEISANKPKPKKTTLTMQYWVNLEDDVPMFHAHMEIYSKDTRFKLDGTKGDHLRWCVEFGTPEAKLTWREQIMFRADLTKANTRSKIESEKTHSIAWDKQVVGKKGSDGVTAADLNKGLYFCSLPTNQDNPVMAPENAAQSDYVDHWHNFDPKKADTSSAEKATKNNLFLDWKRPFTEGDENSMDFESGKKYEVFISFFVGQDTDTKTSLTWADVTSNKPNFQPIYL